MSRVPTLENSWPLHECDTAAEHLKPGKVLLARFLAWYDLPYIWEYSVASMHRNRVERVLNFLSPFFF